MLAIEAPLFKMSILAAGALAAAAFVAPHHHRCCGHHAQTTHRLVLHAAEQPSALYLSAWMDGNDVRVELDTSDLQAMRFETRANITDGCRWLGTETLVPSGDHFNYSYDETILWCADGATPSIKTPRTGTVTIDQ